MERFPFSFFGKDVTLCKRCKGCKRWNIKEREACNYINIRQSKLKDKNHYFGLTVTTG